ncbi:MAG: MBL fold metallo-hydrolase [Acholeplasmataceae bacterium]
MKVFRGNDENAHAYLVCRFDQCYVIDPASHYAEISDALGSRKLMGVLLTHAHSDHVDDIERFNVPIYIHMSDAALLFMDEANGYHPRKHPYQRRNLTIRSLMDCMRLPLGNGYIEVMHTPGHTKGSCSFLHRDEIYTGDTLFFEAVGRHDLYSGNLSELKRSVLRIMELPAQTRICPGHDRMSSIRHEQRNNPFYGKWKKQLRR